MAQADKICAHCGKPFHMNTSPANIARQRLCSRSCGHAVMREIPSFDARMKEKLAERSSHQVNGCILYTGQNNGTYGQIEYRRKTYLAHRVAYQLAKGDIPKGHCVCHQCDTPLCINPDHLWLGSYKDNVADMYAKKRFAYNPIKKLSDETMKDFRIAIAEGLTHAVIAARFGVSKSYVSMVSTGARRRLG